MSPLSKAIPRVVSLKVASETTGIIKHVDARTGIRVAAPNIKKGMSVGKKVMIGTGATAVGAGGVVAVKRRKKAAKK